MLSFLSTVIRVGSITVQKCDAHLCLDGAAAVCLFCSQVVVPPKELVLAGKDAAAEYDELAEPQDFQDDPE